MRRRRQGSAPWLQRNALSVAAVSVLAAVLGLGFGLLQTINRPDPTPALLAMGGQGDPTTVTSATTASVTGGRAPDPIFANPNATTAVSAGGAAREIQAAATVIQPSYTVQSGDTLGKIAAQFNTTAERIQALNNLTDPRALRIGTKLVIPQPFQP